MRTGLLLWPADPASQLFWAHVALWWMIVNYLTWEDPVSRNGQRDGYELSRRGMTGRVALRVLLVVLTILLTAGSGRVALLLSATVLILGALLPAGRQLAADRKRLAEWEVTVNGLFLLTTSALLANGSKAAPVSLKTIIALPVSNRNVAAYVALAAATVFLARGATFVVRGILEQAGTLPDYAPEGKQQPITFALKLKYHLEADEWRLRGRTRPSIESPEAQAPSAKDLVAADSEQTDSRSPDQEVRRGRMIGNIERFILLLLALVGSYPAVGFLMAAKGFVRAKEFENRNYAEYFLIGTLVSTALALTIGTLLRIAFGDVWPT